VHRDIKPDHFLLRCGSQQTEVQIIDFGLAKRFRHPRTRQHIPHSSGTPFVGTTRYCSLASHAGAEQTRRDDLESIAYVLIYLRRGSLPWQGLQNKSKSLQKKRQTSIAKLCSDLPTTFESFLRYTRSLEFDEEPDYDYLRKIFSDLGVEEGYGDDTAFDWDIPLLRRNELEPQGTPTQMTPAQTNVEPQGSGCRM
jgi:serine/threonine protein kinase